MLLRFVSGVEICGCYADILMGGSFFEGHYDMIRLLVPQLGALKFNTDYRESTAHKLMQRMHSRLLYLPIISSVITPPMILTFVPIGNSAESPIRWESETSEGFPDRIKVRE